MEHNIHAIEEAFSRMKKAGWNPNGGVKWGFYFFDKQNTALLKMKDVLLRGGYSVDYFGKMEGDTEWVLHVSRIESHTVRSLHYRNRELNELANKFQIDVYDWWDVERISQNSY